jgi:hypothetical protein
MRKAPTNHVNYLAVWLAMSVLLSGCMYSQKSARKYIEDAERQWAESVPTNAIAQGNESWVQKDKAGKETRGRFIWSDVWVLRGGHWQMVQAQDQSIGP